MKNMYYHKINVINTLTQNHWVLVALAFVAIATVIGMSQYCIRNHRLTKRFGDGPYFLLGVTSAIVMSAMLVIESLAGIIQLLDNLIVGNEPAILNPVAAFFVAIVFGIVFGVIIVIIGDTVSNLHRQSLINKLRLKTHRKKNPYKLGATSLPATRASTPLALPGNRKVATNYYTKVNAGYGMRRR